MNISYLITAYNNFHHLIRLIDKIDDVNSYIYVHVDKKSVIPEFFYEYIKKMNRVTIIQKVTVWWGGWSHQQAILELIFLARKKKTDYYIIMSGQDYPIKNNKCFLQVLQTKREYINIVKGFQLSKPEDRVRYYHFDCFDRRSNSITSLFYKLVEKIYRHIHIKKKYPFKSIYHGSTWCALTSDCIEFIIDYINKNPEFVRFYKTSWCPEESFFHTIIGNSTFYDRVSPGLWYTDWNGKNPPVVMTEMHINLFKEKLSFYSDTYDVNYIPYFVRKFNDNSKELINMLDVKN